MKHPLLCTIISILFVNAMAQDDAVTKIAVLGCHNQGSPAPAIPYFADKLQPDYSIWIGDNVYADTETDPQHIQRQLEVLENKDGYKKLRDNSKYMVTWDDHDYGLNDAGKDYVFKEESKQIHRKFWRLENEIPSERDGIYYAKLEKQPNGKVIQFIMLDGRFNRDDPGPEADALGENQWKFLESELKKPADLRFILCGYQVLLNKPTRWEAWIKLGKSRERLFDLIKSTGAQNIVFVTGDQHYVEVLHSPSNVDYKTFEIMAAGINKNEVPGIATNRSMKADKTIHSAPIIEVHWTADPYIHFKNYDVEKDRVNSDFRFKLSEIGWK
ncbi:MAG: alkaline phosphatase family protein [Flavobacteriales bacterium]|nr:alkaline phosphatase family protein [Flavobacteriales bacterium]MCB9192009.1 alkaline phosphatase family protein [Flavobacteriales bacterium]MCB9205029.1 alkaline phosphatase family protein [Flavobacteriales bacterium]